MSQSKTEQAEPKWISYAREFHNRLVESANENEYGELLWTGKYLDEYRATGASMAHYTRISRCLTGLELIAFRQRGNRYQDTVIEIREKLWPSDAIPSEHLTEARHAATLVAEVEGRVKSLTAWRESLEKGGLDLAKVLQDFELRITRLERELHSHGKKKR